MAKSSKNKKASHFCEALSEPCRIRTCDRLLRREVLYPAELLARVGHSFMNPQSLRSIVKLTIRLLGSNKNFVGVAGFEPATSSSQTRRDNRATLHPEILFNLIILRRDRDSNPGYPLQGTTI